MIDGKNQYSSIYPHVFEVLDRELDHLVLLYGNSAEKTVNALGFQVERTQRTIIRPSANPSLSSPGTLSFGYFGSNGFSSTTSNPGDDVFRVDNRRESTIIEYGIAVSPDDIYVGVQNGDGDAINGIREGGDRDRGYGADDLDTIGGVESQFTRATTTNDAEIPTTALSGTPRQGIVRIDSDQNGLNNFRFAFQNNSGASQNVDVEGYGLTYEVDVLSPEQTRRVYRGDMGPRRVITYGGFGNANPNLPAEWISEIADVSYTIGADNNSGQSGRSSGVRGR